MLITVKNTDTQSMSISERDVRGLSVNAVLFAASAGTAMTGTLVDQNKIRIKAIVKRAGSPDRTVYDEQIKWINALSSFYKPNFVYFTASTKDVVLANATGVTEKAILPMFCDFGKNFHLTGDEKMHVTIQTDGFCSDSSVATATSYLEIVPLDGEGIDDSNGEFVVYNVQAGKTSDSVDLGEGVTDILFLNTDKSDILDASAPISAASVDSKQFKFINITRTSLLAIRNAQFDTKAESDLRYQSFKLYEGDPIDGCKVSLSLNSSNVNASACWIIARKRTFTPTSVARGVEQQSKKEAKILEKAGNPAQAQVVRGGAKSLADAIRGKNKLGR